MCVLRTHIKLSIFRNIFSKIEKAVITFSILEKKISKNKINVCLSKIQILKAITLLEYL